MKLKAAVNKLLKAKEPALTNEACDCCISEKPSKVFKVTISILDSEWYSSIQRYVIVNPSRRDEVIISETKLVEFLVDDAWSARDMLDSSKFDYVKVETVK